MRRKQPSKKTKIKARWSKRINPGIYFGLLLGAIICCIWLIIQKRHVGNTSQLSIHVRKQYYDPQVFKEPAGLIKGVSTNSAKFKIPIIMYHYIEYVKDANDTTRKSLNVTPYTFEKELASLNSHHYQTYFLKDLPDILNGSINYSTQSAILTFDDGYADFYTDAFPLLKKYQIKATIFIVNNFIGRKGFLNKDQIQELLNSKLVEVGAHTLDHVYLKAAPEKTAQKEILESKLSLEKMFGSEVKTFAYPFGAFTQQTLDLVKGATFSAAVSVIPGTIQNEENLFYLSRLRPGMFSGENIVRVLENYKK